MPSLHHSVFTGQMPFLLPNQQRPSTAGTLRITGGKKITGQPNNPGLTEKWLLTTSVRQEVKTDKYC